MASPKQNNVVSIQQELSYIGSDLQSMRQYVHQNIVHLLTYADEADYWIFKCTGNPLPTLSEDINSELTVFDSRNELDPASLPHAHAPVFFYAPTICPGERIQAESIIPTIIFNRGLLRNHFRSIKLPNKLKYEKDRLASANTMYELNIRLKDVQEAMKTNFKEWLAEQYQLLLQNGSAALAPEEPGYFMIIPNQVSHARHISKEHDNRKDGGVGYSEFVFHEPGSQTIKIGHKSYRLQNGAAVDL